MANPPNTKHPWEVSYVSLDFETTGLSTSASIVNMYRSYELRGHERSGQLSWQWKGGAAHLPSLETARQAFKHIAPLELSVSMGTGHAPEYFNYIIQDYFTPGTADLGTTQYKPTKDVPYREYRIEGQTFSARRFRAKMQSAEDITNAFIAMNGNRLLGRKWSAEEAIRLGRYFGSQSEYRDIIEISMGNGRTVQIDAGALNVHPNRQISDTIDFLQNVLVGNKEALPKGFQGNNLFDFIAKAEADIANKKDPNLGINKIVSEIIRKAEKDNDFYLASWNAAMDINFLRVLVANHGDPDLSEKFEKMLFGGDYTPYKIEVDAKGKRKAVRDNASVVKNIKVKGAEREFQELMYGLLKDDPERIKQFGIRNRLDAVAFTGKLPGAIPRTLEEFVHSTPWQQSIIVGPDGLFNWWKPTQMLHKGKVLAQSHHASPDTIQTEPIIDVSRRIKLAFSDLLEERLFDQSEVINHIKDMPFAGFLEDELFSQHGDLLRQAVARVMGEQESEFYGWDESRRMHQVELMLDKLTARANNIKKQQIKSFPAYLRKKEPPLKQLVRRLLTSKGLTDIRSIVFNNKYKAPLSIAGLSAFMLGSTYLSSDPNSKFNPSKKIKDVIFGGVTHTKEAQVYRSVYKEASKEMGGHDGSPFIGTMFFSKIVPGTMLALSTVYTAGLLASETKGRLLGVRPYFGSNTTEQLKEHAKTLRYGMRALEDAFPKIRVFKFSAALDFILGRRTGSVMRPDNYRSKVNKYTKSPMYYGSGSKFEGRFIEYAEDYLREIAEREGNADNLLGDLRADALFHNAGIALELHGTQHEADFNVAIEFYKRYNNPNKLEEGDNGYQELEDTWRIAHAKQLANDQKKKALLTADGQFAQIDIHIEKTKDMSIEEEREHIEKKIDAVFKARRDAGEPIRKPSNKAKRALNKGMRIELANYGEVKDWRKLHYIDDFLDAAEKTNSIEYQKMMEIINRDQEALKLSRINKSIVIISRMQNGGALVTITDLDHQAAIHGRGGASIQHKFQFDDIDFKIIDRYRKVKDRGRTINTIANEWIVSDVFKRRGIKKTWSEYIKQYSMPSYIKDKPILSALWYLEKGTRYMLDIDAKQLNQNRNKLYDIDYLDNVEDAIVVTRLFNEHALSQENLSRKFNYFSKLPMEMVSAMNRFLETPFDFFGVEPAWMRKKAAKLKASGGPLERIAGKIISGVTRPHLGLNPSLMKYGFPQYLAEFGAKRLLPGAIALGALGGIDRLLGKLTLDPTGRGPLSNIPIKAYEAGALAYSKISDITGMTHIAKRQEQVAPGSTGVGIFAFPASIFGVTLAATHLVHMGPTSLGDTISEMRNVLTKGSTKGYSGPLKGLLKTLNRNTNITSLINRPIGATAGQKFFSWAVKNPAKGLFALAMIPMSPYMPGFIGSNKTYQERKAEFAGDRDVAIRKYRGWVLSTSPFMGGKVDHFRKHALTVYQSDYENRGVVWPSYAQHLAHNITGGLWGRYMLEDYHKDRQPVAESAPYAASVPLLGPIMSSTIGKVIKPTRSYIEDRYDTDLSEGSYPAGNISMGSVTDNMQQWVSGADIRSKHSAISQFSSFTRQFTELAGFKGFAGETFINYLTGKKLPDFFIPHWQDATQMYNPARTIWQYQAGDISGVGGEFLRRIYQNPEQKWEVNPLPNEFNRLSWVPDALKIGTTFDKHPMGWLYATGRGWEAQHPELSQRDMEFWPDEIKTEILSKIAPFSEEYNTAAQRTLNIALAGSFTPRQEQKYYETLTQVNELKKTLYAHSASSSYKLELEKRNAIVTDFDPFDFTFTMSDTGKQRYKLAGIATTMQDIRANLLKTQHVSGSHEIDRQANEIMSNMRQRIESVLAIGGEVAISRAIDGNISGEGNIKEAIVSGLNYDLIRSGIPLANTGNISMYNMQQRQQGLLSRPLGKVWDMINHSMSFWSKKMLSNRDYLNQYEISNVYNRDVKLWNYPIKHFVQPFISSVLKTVGIDFVPSFTKKRRDLQEYWDVIKYIKYKKLSDESRYRGNMEDAKHYEDLWRQTMVGANPMEDEVRNVLLALPQNERPFFNFFANEASPSKRRKIAKLLPESARRLYKGIWAKRLGENNISDDYLAALQATEGWDVGQEDVVEHDTEAPNSSMADYMRAKHVAQYAKTHTLPGENWRGWTEGVNVDNAELLALHDLGEQVQDYGYFDSHMRSAAFDKQAYIAAHSLHTTSLSSSQAMGMLMSEYAADDEVKDISGQPTSSMQATIERTINTSAAELGIVKSQSGFLHLVDDIFLIGARFLRF